MSRSIITNDNIKEFVDRYIIDWETLPASLQRKRIGEWDISRVTDMSELFRDMKFL